MLRAWPRIRAGVGPGATLHVYYGFTPKFLKWGRQHMRNFDAWLADTKALLDQPGVVYVGLVDQVTLARAYARAGYCLYPTSYPETGCVSLMKAQAMGAVPVTSRYRKSTLPELTGQFDLGPPERDGEINRDPAWQREWADAAVAAATRGAAEDARHRAAMKAWAREEFRWEHVAKLWSGYFAIDDVEEQEEEQTAVADRCWYFKLVGKVQRVMCRQTLMRAAQRHGVRAGATNEADGSVALTMCGAHGEVAAIASKLAAGGLLNNWGAQVTALNEAAEGRAVEAHQVHTGNVDEIRWNPNVEFYL